MVSHRHVRKYVGQHVHCHTHFGTFQGVIVHVGKHHIILGSVPTRLPGYEVDPAAYMERQMPMGPGGPGGPGGRPPGGGGGWHMAIPIAAILGITAVGMHWW